jgi:hypothetical protein
MIVVAAAEATVKTCFLVTALVDDDPYAFGAVLNNRIFFFWKSDDVEIMMISSE